MRSHLSRFGTCLKYRSCIRLCPQRLHTFPACRRRMRCCSFDRAWGRPSQLDTRGTSCWPWRRCQGCRFPACKRQRSTACPLHRLQGSSRRVGSPRTMKHPHWRRSCLADTDHIRRDPAVRCGHRGRSRSSERCHCPRRTSRRGIESIRCPIRWRSGREHTRCNAHALSIVRSRGCTLRRRRRPHAADAQGTRGTLRDC